MVGWERPIRYLHCPQMKGNSLMSTPTESDHHPLELHPVVSTERARQGATGHNVRYVLGFGTAAIVVLFAIIWLVYFG